MKDREFDTSCKFLNGKVNELPKQGLGKKKHRADPLTEEELLWSQQVPGADTALNLNLTVFYLISQQFDTCGCPKPSSAEGRTQFINSPCAGTTEYVEGPTKTKQAGLRKVNRRITQRMFATSDSRCPVKYLERLISKQPQPHRNPAHFTFSPSPSPSLTDICYFIQPMGINKIDGFMKKLQQWEVLTSPKSTLLITVFETQPLQNFRKQKYPMTKIIAITGHKTEQSIKAFVGTDLDSHISALLSKRRPLPYRLMHNCDTYHTFPCSTVWVLQLQCLLWEHM